MKASRPLKLIWAVVIATIVLCIVWVQISDRRRYAAAEASLTEARAFLDAHPAYRHLIVEVSDAEGGALWFQGRLPTFADERAFQRAVRSRFGDRGFLVIAPIFWDEPAPMPANASTLPTRS